MNVPRNRLAVMASPWRERIGSKLNAGVLRPALGLAAVAILFGSAAPVRAQLSLSSEIGRPESSDAASGDPPVVIGADGKPIGAIPKVELPPELQAEADKIQELFRQRRDEMEQAIADMRDTHVRFLNGEDQSPDAFRRYREQRDLARRKMDETYLVAIDLFRFMPDETAAQYIATIVQHRLGLGVYNVSTLEGAARLIDAGVNYLYLFQAAARSAVVVGDFPLAKRLYEAIEEEKYEVADKALIAQMNELETNFKEEQAIREREAAEDKLPRVVLHTTRGDVTLELFVDNAPSTAANFIQLVEDGFYDGLDFYQVIEDLLLLTGDPSGVGTGGSGRMLVDEHERPDARKAFRGSLVMAKVPVGKTGTFVPNSASSQFAILYLPLTHASYEQTVFGRVIEGMNVLSALRRVDPSKEKKKNEVVLPPDRILSAEVIRRPETLPEPMFAN